MNHETAIEKAGGFRAHLPYSMEMINTATKEMPSETRDAVRWLFGHGKQHGLSTSQLGSLIKATGSTVSKLFTNTYEVDDYGPITSRILNFRKVHLLQSTRHDAGFVITSVVHRIRAACELALQQNKIVFLFGHSHCGKTEALTKYAQEHNHGATRYVEMPTGAATRALLDELAKTCLRSPRSNYNDLKARVFGSIDKSNLVIIDEFTKVFPEGSQQCKVKTVEFIRELHDRTKCGLVLCGTYIARDSMESKLHRKLLEQIINRSALAVEIPKIKLGGDVDAFAERFGLSTPTGLAEDIIKIVLDKFQLGHFKLRLDMAAARAKRSGEKMTWDHFIYAHNALIKFGDPDSAIEEEGK